MPEPTYTDPIVEHYYEQSGRDPDFLREFPPPIGFICTHERWVYGWTRKTRGCPMCGKFERVSPEYRGATQKVKP